MAERQLLAIVPARGGSKGVPRKNLRQVNGRPLVHYALTSVAKSGVAQRIVLSSDDESILAWGQLHGYETHERPDHLAADEVTISEVAAHLADTLEWSEDVAVFQPTSPLTRPETIAQAVSVFREGGWDSLASCIRESHLYWYESPDPDGAPRISPLFQARVNRQQARSGVLRETGAIQLVRGERLRRERDVVTECHHLFEVPSEESLDVDDFDDLAIARRRLESAHIVFRLTANREVGSGHLFHCLQLADELNEHRVTFLLRECDEFAEHILADRGCTWQAEKDLRQDLLELRSAGGALVVNDILDTTEEEILEQRILGYKVVNIEDLGPGSAYADWVVNALYEDSGAADNSACGPQWAVLRDEFHEPPPKEIAERAQRVLITFGGTDPNGLAARCARLIASDPELEVTVVLGPGARDADLPEQVSVRGFVRSMAAEMHASDLVLTSAGRTVYEAAAMGTPVVVLAQNAREATHAHLSYESGVVFLGIGPLVDDSHIELTTRRLIGDPSLRRELSARLSRTIDNYGAERIAARIRSILQEPR